MNVKNKYFVLALECVCFCKLILRLEPVFNKQKNTCFQQMLHIFKHYKVLKLFCSLKDFGNAENLLLIGKFTKNGTIFFLIW